MDYSDKLLVVGGTGSIIFIDLYDLTAPLEALDLRAAHAAFIMNNGDVWGFFETNGGQVRKNIDGEGHSEDLSNYTKFGQQYDDAKMYAIICDQEWEKQFQNQYHLLAPILRNGDNCQQWLDAIKAEYVRRYGN